MTPWDVQSRRIFTPDGPWPALYGGEGGGHGYVMEPKTCDARGIGIGKPGDPCFTLTAGDRHGVCAGFLARQGAKASGIGYEENKAPTLRGGQADAAVVYAPVTGHTLKGKSNCDYREDSETYVVDKVQQKVTHGVDARSLTEHEELNGTLQAGYGINCGQAIREDLVVRRLTPLECERLQGYPDHWTRLPLIETMSEEDFRFWDDVRREHARVMGKSYKTPKGIDGMVKWYNKMVEADSHRYQSLGNSIALPQWKWLCKRLCGHYERDATMGSLFDGIGGFPLIWEQINGKGSCLWASEIEPFQIAVTRLRFR